MAENNKKPRAMINGRFPKPPFWLTSVILIGLCLSLLVFMSILRSRGAFSHLPRVHLIQDMDNQVKVKTQHASEVFADGLSIRPKIPGTVAWGQLKTDDHLYRGYSSTWNNSENKFQVRFLNGIPVEITPNLLARGQTKFNTYCMPCHGYDGLGNGPVSVRATQLQQNGVAGMSWVAPSNLTDATIMARPDGHIYNTIVNGIRNMPGYGTQVTDVNDRWAIVAYVRALQLSHTGSKPKAEKTVLATE
ncbi:MAG: quinol:cytochrome C oxidoreductase [Phycisphaerae bacterium]|jgi:mono/diheme cytochrome c family protein|nr:MAG: quinol:cytochrome C oxidoreductase [Phycisphaerae bacterium]